MIFFDDVSKRHIGSIAASRKEAIREILGLNSSSRFLGPNEHFSVREVSFLLEDGESLGIVVDHHTSKIAMASLICGLTQPSHGFVKIAGTARFVRNMTIGTTPFMTVRNYLYLLCMLFGLDRNKLFQTSEEILEACEMLNLVDEKIGDVDRRLISRLGYYTSIFVESDVYVFFKLKFENSKFGSICQKRFKEILGVKTVVVLQEKSRVFDFPVDKVMSIYGGRKLFWGTRESASEIDKIQNIIEREGTFYDKNVSHSLSKLFLNYKKSSKVVKKGANKEVSKQDDRTNTLEILLRKITGDQLDMLAKKSNMIVVGPFLSDVGIELLYWIPFLRCLIESFGFDKNRLIAISRCGADLWYQNLGIQYVDIGAILGEEQTSLLLNERIASRNMKQFSPTEIEMSLIDKFCKENALKSYDLIHPSMMYNLFLPVWKRQLPPKFILHYTRYAPFIDAKRGDIFDDLPEDFIAVKFSFCPQFPDTSKNRLFLEKLLTELSNLYEVVFLNTGIQIDMHVDFIPKSTNFFSLDHKVKHGNLLDIQTRIIKHSRLYVGTNTNISYLPPFMGIKTINIYSEKNSGISPVNSWLFDSFSSGIIHENFSVIDVSSLNIVEVLNRIKVGIEN